MHPNGRQHLEALDVVGLVEVDVALRVEAERFIERFMQAGLDDARRRGLDGIVCGHIHRAALLQRDGLVYANDGDWVESLSALVEEADGTLRLLAHTGAVLAEILPRTQPMAPTAPVVLPRAA